MENQNEKYYYAVVNGYDHINKMNVPGGFTFGLKGDKEGEELDSEALKVARLELKERGIKERKFKGVMRVQIQ